MDAMDSLVHGDDDDEAIHVTDLSLEDEGAHSWDDVESFDVEEEEAPVTARQWARVRHAPWSPEMTRVLGIVFVVVVLMVVALAGVLAFTWRHTSSAPDGPALTHWSDVRLPSSITPEAYSLHLDVDMKQWSVHGEVTIKLNIAQRSNIIVLHAVDLSLDEIYLLPDDSTGTKRMSYDRKTYNGERQYWVITFPELREYSKDATSATPVTVTLHASWTSSVRVDALAGFYRSSYKDGNGRVQYLASTHFEPTDARRAFPCFDEPALKATFELCITTDAEYGSVLANMPEQERHTLPSGRIQVSFQRSPRLSTYLVAFAVTKFASVHGETKRGLPVKVWSSAATVSQCDYALTVARGCIDFFGDYYGIQFPLPKMDLIAIPDFSAGAMENMGLITFRTTALLYDPAESSTANKQRVAVVVAHELAHQWFGDLVTMKWWNALWLNEGFASYMEWLGVDAVEPEWNIRSQFVFAQQQALHLDALASSHAIDVPVSDPASISSLFDTISYSKGASVLQMVNAWLEREQPGSFQKGIQAYLKKFAYGNAATHDLWESLSEASGQPVVDMTDRWTLAPGYPLLTVTASEPPVASQARFLAIPPDGKCSHDNGGDCGRRRSDRRTEDTLWWIPFTYASEATVSAATHTFPLAGVTHIELPSSAWHTSDPTAFFLANPGHDSYYRVAYDRSMLDALAREVQQQGVAAVMSPSDAYGLLSDIVAVSKVDPNIYVASDFMEWVTLLQGSESYIVWSAIVSGLETMSQLLMDEPYSAMFDGWASSQLQRLVAQLGWFVDEENGEAHNAKLLRSLILDAAVAFNNSDATAQGQAHFDAFRTTGAPLAPDVRAAAYHAAVQGEADSLLAYDWLLQRYSSTQNPSESIRCLNSLAVSQHEATMASTLQLALNANVVRPQDTIRLVLSVARSSKAGRDMAWAFFRHNYATFKARYGTAQFSMASLIAGVTQGFNTLQRRDEVEAFFADKTPDSGAKAIPQSLEVITSNARWLTTNAGLVQQWLSSRS